MSELHLESDGSGPSLVLLHANGGDHRDFGAIVPALVSSGWRVTTLDWPGHGASPRRKPETAVGFGELLPRVLADIGGTHVLLGNSVGGFAALHAAAHHPDLIAGLVLVSPGGFTPHWAGTTLACNVIGSRLVAPPAYRSMPRLYLRDRNAGVTAAIARAAEASRSPERVETFSSIWRSFTDPGHDARQFADQVRCPALLAWGTHDPVLPWRLDGRRARAALPHADVVTFAGAGHQPFIERPDEFLEGIAPFLGRLHSAMVA